MNNIKKRALQGKLEYKGSIILTYEIEYPEITSSNYDLGKNNFNYYNRNMAIKLENRAKNELFEEAKKLYDYNISNGFPVMTYEVIKEYEITYNEDYIVSLYSDEYEFTGGAHGNTIRSSQNWNLQTSRQLKLSSFFPNNEYYIIDVLKNINQQIKEQLKYDNNIYFPDYCELVLDTFRLENYYLTRDAIAIFFQTYDIAPHSSGIPVFYIAYK